MENQYIEQERYQRAAKRVKQIKGFYSHALVYTVINIMIVVINLQNLEPEESYFQWHNFTTLFFWGLGLLAHGLSVFAPTFMMGKDWEERKIREYMEKSKSNRWD